MIRQLFVCTAVLGCIGLLWPWGVEAQQCTGQYANDPIFTVLTPKDAGAAGYVTATITGQVSNVFDSQGKSLGVASHNLKATVGTTIQWTVASNNATSATLLVYANGNLQGSYAEPLNGSAGTWTLVAGNLGDTYSLLYKVSDANGQTSQDLVTLYVPTGNGPSIVFQDALETNFYQQVTTTGGGSSMLTSCTECAGTGGGLPHCINATHTPYSTISLTNSNSGESQSLPWQQSGNVARSNESVSFSASLAISVLPGDSGTISIEHKIICIMDGIIFDQQLPKPKTSPTGGSWFPRATGELAFTKVALTVPTNCTPLLDPKGNVIGLHCAVAYYCSARSSKPDYQPTGLKTYHYTNPALVPTFWMSMSPGTALVFGDGPGQIVVWYFPFSELDGVLTDVGGMDPLLLDILSPAWPSDSSSQDCTNYAKGISPWYMPKW